MPRFRYIAFDASGKREEGQLDMASLDLAWSRLSGLGLTVVDLSADDASQRHISEVFKAARPIPAMDQADLAEQLSVLLGAKLPILEVLRVAETTTPRAGLRRVLRRTGQLIQEGQTLPDAIADAGPGLTPLFSSIIRVGQGSNQLPEMMSSLAKALRRQEKLSTQVGGALVYPFILITGGIVVFLMMTLFLAPRLEVIFTSTNKPVPAELSFFVGFGRFLETWGTVLALALAVCAFTGFAMARMRRAAIMRGIAALPILGPVVRDMSLTRLVTSLGLLLRAGVPIVEAMRQTSRSFPDQIFAATFDRAASTIESGRKGSEVFSQDSLISPLFRELYAVGEAANTLPDVLMAVATSLEDQIERRIQRLLALLTPMLTLIVGGGIAILVYSVMGALLSVNDLAF